MNNNDIQSQLDSMCEGLAERIEDDAYNGFMSVLDDALEIKNNGYQRAIVFTTGGPHVEVEFSSPSRAHVNGYWGSKEGSYPIRSSVAEQLSELLFCD